METNLPYVLTDCDGTIAHPQQLTRNLTETKILEYQAKSNFKLSFITGRNPVGNKQLVEQLKIKLPIVGANGAVILDSQTWKVLDYHSINVDFLTKLLQWEGINDITITFFEPEAIMMLKSSPWYQFNLDRLVSLEEKYHYVVHGYDSIDELINDLQSKKSEVVQMIISSNDQSNENQPLKMFLNQYREFVSYLENPWHTLKVGPAGISKATGLKKWAELVKTEPQEIVVFGDNYNDLEMFQEVKHSYAMEEAVEPLKAVAFKVIGKLEDDAMGLQLEKLLHLEY